MCGFRPSRRTILGGLNSSFARFAFFSTRFFLVLAFFQAGEFFADLQTVVGAQSVRAFTLVDFA
jgi:hypothetical protein